MSTIKRHPEGFNMYHSALDYRNGEKVIVRIEDGPLEGNLLMFTYDEWDKFTTVT